MSRRANPKIVGGFVLAAIALLVAAALVFGSFTFFETTRRFVVFFEGSVDGLTAGSPVLFRGVPLGKVVDVGIRYDPKDSSFEIPVIIEIRPGVIARFSPTVSPNAELMKELIDQGLRARLESASLVTGQQVVQLNFFPGTPVNLQKTDLPYFQLPTVPSPTQQIMSSVDVAARDLPTLIRQAGVILDRVQRFLSPENENAIHRHPRQHRSDDENTAGGCRIARSGYRQSQQHRRRRSIEHTPQRGRRRQPRRHQGVRSQFPGSHGHLNKLTDQLNQFVAYNRMPIRQFTEGTLPDLTALIIDARTTVNKATAVLDSLERNPTRFIFGNRWARGSSSNDRSSGGCPAGEPSVHARRPRSRDPSLRLSPPAYWGRAAAASIHPASGDGFPAWTSPVKWSLVVDEPTAPRQIDTSRIALMSGPFRVEYYADVEWTDNAPAMVQLLLIQSFENTGRLPVVAPSRQTLATDFLLLSSLRKFQVEKDAPGSPQATVVLEATLLRMPRRTPIATARFKGNPRHLHIDRSGHRSL